MASLLLGMVFGLLLLAANTFDLFLSEPIAADRPLAFTLRIPGIGIYSDTMESGGATFQHVRRIYPRGSVLTGKEIHMVRAVEDLRRPPRFSLILGLGMALVLVLYLFGRFTAAESREAGHLRTQVVLVASLSLFAVAAKLSLLFGSWSAMWIPLSLLVIPTAIHLGQRCAAAVAVAGSVILAMHTRIDVMLLLVMLGQGLSAAALAGWTGRFRTLSAGVGAAAGGGAAYLASSLLLLLHQPLAGGLLRQSGLSASVASGALGAVLALGASPLLGRALGIMSRSRLLALANLDSPLLKQLSSKAPGSWAHSMAVANMAEMAANAIGADGLLVRVGAYYHDIGKSSQPRYFIENQEGENPHDALAPDVSADAIFGHVTEGVKLARKHKLPQAVVEFIVTHHGHALLEFFWHKNQEAGNPKKLDEEDFRYPGPLPGTRETAILTLCDAVEAASRTLEDPTREELRELVFNIALGKLDHDLLDESGLHLQELHRMMDSLVETLRSSRHARVRYPWQTTRSEARTGNGHTDAPVPQTPAQPEAGDDPAWASLEQPPDNNNDDDRGRVMTKPLGVPREEP